MIGLLVVDGLRRSECSGESTPFLGSDPQAFAIYGCLARNAGPLIEVKKRLGIYDPNWKTVIKQSASGGDATLVFGVRMLGQNISDSTAFLSISEKVRRSPTRRLRRALRSEPEDARNLPASDGSRCNRPRLPFRDHRTWHGP